MSNYKTGGTYDFESAEERRRVVEEGRSRYALVHWMEVNVKSDMLLALLRDRERDD